MKNTIIEQSEGPVTLDTCDKSDEQKLPDQQKENDKDKDNNKHKNKTFREHPQRATQETCDL